MYDSQPGMGIGIWETDTKLHKRDPKNWKIVLFHVYNMWY